MEHPIKMDDFWKHPPIKWLAGFQPSTVVVPGCSCSDCWCLYLYLLCSSPDQSRKAMDQNYDRKKGVQHQLTNVPLPIAKNSTVRSNTVNALAWLMAQIKGPHKPKLSRLPECTWVFPKNRATRKLSIFNRLFHYFHHPFWVFTPYFWFNTHMCHPCTFSE